MKDVIRDILMATGISVWITLFVLLIGFLVLLAIAAYGNTLFYLAIRRAEKLLGVRNTWWRVWLLCWGTDSIEVFKNRRTKEARSIVIHRPGTAPREDASFSG